MISRFQYGISLTSVDQTPRKAQKIRVKSSHLTGRILHHMYCYFYVSLLFSLEVACAQDPCVWCAVFFFFEVIHIFQPRPPPKEGGDGAIVLPFTSASAAGIFCIAYIFLMHLPMYVKPYQPTIQAWQIFSIWELPCCHAKVAQNYGNVFFARKHASDKPVGPIASNFTHKVYNHILKI